VPPAEPEEVDVNIALWIAQGILAAVFLASGLYKISHSKESLVAKGQTGVIFFPTAFIRFIALSELLAVVALLVPGLTGIALWLTPLAASGLAVIMVAATFCHARLAGDWEEKKLRRKEFFNVLTTVPLLLVCLFVAVGRLEIA
jgi:uncharacterized membrane protein YphA (DoxX/SURF4 family)